MLKLWNLPCINFSTSYWKLYYFCPGKPISDCSQRLEIVICSEISWKWTRFGLMMVSFTFRKKSLSLTKILTNMIVTLSDNPPALSTGKMWAAEFRGRRQILEVNPRFGRPATAATMKNNDRVEALPTWHNKLKRYDMPRG